MSDAALLDRRSARTRRAILQAFVQLVLERRYDDISIADIVTLADVGRSTFYEHFRSKDDLLHHSMAWLLKLIAGSIRPGSREATLRAVAHFWDNRWLARTLLAHPIGPAVRRSLVAFVEEVLGEEEQSDRELMNARAVQIAAAQLALVEAWARGEVVATREEIADRLAAAGRM
jgi:AcrR family transcriptional regulator